MRKTALTLLFALTLTSTQAFGITYEDLNSVKEPAYRIGVGDKVETKPLEVKSSVNSQSVKEEKDPFAEIEKLTYADLSIKKISTELSQDLDIDYDVMMGDLALLWRGAASKSDIIKFALYKLSNPDADKPNDKSVKKVLQTIAGMSTLLGAGIGNPMVATGSFVSGDILGIMSQDEKALNYRYTKVNDADMIILVRKIDELQQNVINIYYDYMTARKMFHMTSKMSKQRYQNYQLAQDSSRELILIADAYYRESLDSQMKARSEFYAKRAMLEQLVGNETFKQFEEIIADREKEENTK